MEGTLPYLSFVMTPTVIVLVLSTCLMLISFDCHLVCRPTHGLRAFHCAGREVVNVNHMEKTSSNHNS